MLTTAMAIQNLRIHRRPAIATFVLHELELLSLLRFLVFFHEAAEEILIISRRLGNVDAGG